jgi:ferredoxin
MGKGMGRGGGMGGAMSMPAPMGMPSTNLAEGSRQVSGTQADHEQELAALKQQAKLLEQQKNQINNRIAQLESGRKSVAIVVSGKCAGCGICEDVCPTNAIKVNGQAMVQPELCTGCGLCVGECPNNAVILTHNKDH